MSEIKGTIDLSAIEGKLDAILAAIKALPSNPGGGNGENPPDPPDNPDPPEPREYSIVGRNFLVNGKTKFLKMANVRAGAWYIENDRPHILNYLTGSAHLDDVLRTLDTARFMGMDVIRFYGAISTNPDGSPGTNIDYCIRRVKNMLDLLDARGMGGIVVLDDNASSGLNVFDGMHEGAKGRPTNWYTSGYRDKYKSFVAQMVGALSGHPGLFGWEVQNEGHLREPHGQAEAKAVFNFMIDIANTIRGISTKEFILPGNETLWQLFANNPTVREDFVKLKAYSALSGHFYSPSPQEPLGANTRLGQVPNKVEEFDLALAAKYNLPFYVGEFGVHRPRENPINAAPITDTYLNHCKSIGLAGVAQWGLSVAMNGGDLGWSDAAGMDNDASNHRYDFDALINVWSKPR